MSSKIVVPKSQGKLAKLSQKPPLMVTKELELGKGWKEKEKYLKKLERNCKRIPTFLKDFGVVRKWWIFAQIY